MSYNCLKDSWSLNELISHCVQEEERLKQDKTKSAYLASTSKDKRKNKKRKTDKEATITALQKKQHKEQTKNGCFFCGHTGHQKKQCINYHAEHAKRGMLLYLVFSEVNLTLVPRHTWWIDSSATTHISVSMQGCLTCRRPSDGERYVYIGDGKSVEVETIETFRLLLKIDYYLDLKDIFVVPSFRRNLISVSVLDNFGYCCSFGNGKFSLFQNSHLVTTGSLFGFDNLYLHDTIASFNESLHVNTIGVKRKLTGENSASLWYKRLCHISKRRIERLMSNGILDPLDFSDFDMCINCIKGKQTNVSRFGANRSIDVL